MKVRYEDPGDISDDIIREAFAASDTIEFSGRPFNTIAGRSIAFGELGWWLPLKRVFPLVGITPQMLRPIFNTPPKPSLPNRWPFNCQWLGLNRRIAEVFTDRIPTEVWNYDQLGYTQLTPLGFQKLSDLIGKTVKVYREDGGTGDHMLLFIVDPNR